MNAALDPGTGGAGYVIQAQMAVLSKFAYDDLKKDFDTRTGWILIENIGSKNTMQAKVFRRYSGNNKYSYAIAYRGTDSWYDAVTDVEEVWLNRAKGQTNDAANLVSTIRTRYSSNMDRLYFTGHSLGGYLAQWVQSEITDGVIGMNVPTATYTYNAPGFTQNIPPFGGELPTFYNKVKEKLKNPSKYTTIENISVNGDLVSLVGTTLGNKVRFNPPTWYNSLLDYHAIMRFLEIYGGTHLIP